MTRLFLRVRVVVLSIAMVSIGCKRENVPPLPHLFQIPPTVLTTHRNTPLDLASLRGNVVVYDFIFTSCAGICPIMTGSMQKVGKEIPESSLRFVSISVDPTRDTPAVLDAYAKKAGAEPRWTLLTGDPEAIRKLSVEGFKLAAATKGTAAEPLLHSSKFVLVDGEGWIRGYYDGTDPESVQHLLRDLRRLLEETS